jgi:outer membrane protein assembly factor BamB
MLRNCLLGLALACALSSFADPIEGKWYGKAGTPLDQVDLGFEFKTNDKHELKAYLYEPVNNYYAMELPGMLKADGETYAMPEYGVSLALKDGALTGTIMGPSTPVALYRTKTLPAEVPVPNLPKGPGPKWQVKLAAPIWATAALRDGVAYVGTTGGIFHAVRIKDGSVAWTFSAGRPMFGEPAVTDDAVYFVCDNGYLFKLERATGKELWRYDLGDGRIDRVMPHPTVFAWDFKAPRPVIADDIIYVGSGDGSLHAVRAAGGERVWRFVPPKTSSRLNVGGTIVEEVGKVRADAAISGPNVIFGSFDGSAYAVDRGTGEMVWKKETHARVDSSPVIAGDKVLVGTFGGILAALDAKTGTVAWTRVWWGSAVISTPVPFGVLAYIGASDLRRVTCFDPKDGRVLWRTDVYGWAWDRPLVTENLIYIGVAGGSPYDMRHVPSMTVLRRDTGRIAWRYPVPESGFVYGFAASPAIEGNTVVIGALDGTLYAFAADGGTS